MLIQEGADVLDVDPASGLTPLMLAARGGHAELCKVGRAGAGRGTCGMFYLQERCDTCLPRPQPVPGAP